jgi:hypothetical protein
MPSIPPAYLYTFIALLAISSLLVLSFIAYTNAARFSSELRELKELTNRIAAKSTEMMNLCQAGNTTVQFLLEVPTTIGHEQFWFQLQNDSQTTWIDSGFGAELTTSSILRQYIPGHAISTGYYLAGNGMALLICDSISEVVQLHLSSSGGTG